MFGKITSNCHSFKASELIACRVYYCSSPFSAQNCSHSIRRSCSSRWAPAVPAPTVFILGGELWPQTHRVVKHVTTAYTSHHLPGCPPAPGESVALCGQDHNGLDTGTNLSEFGRLTSQQRTILSYENIALCTPSKTAFKADLVTDWTADLNQSVSHILKQYADARPGNVCPSCERCPLRQEEWYILSRFW